MSHFNTFDCPYCWGCGTNSERIPCPVCNGEGIVYVEPQHVYNIDAKDFGPHAWTDYKMSMSVDPNVRGYDLEGWDDDYREMIIEKEKQDIEVGTYVI